MDKVVSIPAIDFSKFFSDIVDRLYTFIPILIIKLKAILGFIVGLSFPVSVFLVIAIIYCVEQIKIIRKKEEEMHDLKVVQAEEPGPKANVVMASRWENVKKNINSNNSSDWRQAILEADIILDDLLTKMGYQGSSVGEKLKKVSKGDFMSLNDAWEAHKVRNQIAHEGSSFNLNEHEARKAVSHYRNVFDEFYYI